MRLIDADTLRERMYHETFETDTDMQKWDSGCWIRYKMFENALEDTPTVDAEPVVRCDDCIYRDGKTPGQPNILCWQMHSDDYCSYGTKREVGTYCEDIVSVVRCKDCKWGDITDYGKGEVLECIRDILYRVNSISLEGETYFRKVEPDDFCSWGERRKDETD